MRFIESREIQVRSDIVFGREVAMARSENDHQNEKEDSSRYQVLQQVAMTFWVAAHRGEIQSCCHGTYTCCLFDPRQEAENRKRKDSSMEAKCNILRVLQGLHEWSY